MKEATQTAIEWRQKLETTAYLKVDHMSANLFTLIGYRKSLAEMILKGNYQDDEYLPLAYEQAGDQIKQLLGL